MAKKNQFPQQFVKSLFKRQSDRKGGREAVRVGSWRREREREIWRSIFH